MKELTWEEFYNLALRNYTKGGDSFVECWNQLTFDCYVEGCGPLTEQVALEMFQTSLDIDANIRGYAEW